MRFQRIAEGVVAQYPRLQLVKSITDRNGKPVDVWIVDGEYVREFIDEEFTNFAQHYSKTYIPENEFWIDKEASDNESEFFIEHLLVENKAMSDGKSYEDALLEADLAERDLRRKSGDLAKMIDPVRKIVDPHLAKIKLLKTLEDGVQVWLVDGRLIRSVLNVDFTQGGHEFVYEYVPEGEVWVDNDVAWHERAFVILHELHERNRMGRDRLPYSTAHAESSALELHCRKNHDELHDAMALEGWV